MFPYYCKNIYCPYWFGLPSCLLFLLWASVCAICLDSIFFLKYIYIPKGSSSSEIKEQAQGLLPIDLRLITNILGNLVKMCLFYLIICVGIHY